MDPTLKQRLVGTAVLVGLAVILVPMLLDGPVEQPTQSRTTGVPLELPAEPLMRPDPVQVESPPTATQPQPQPQGELWVVQAGAFRSAEGARTVAERLRRAGFEATVVSSGGFHRVRIGEAADRETQDRLLARIRAAGEEASVVRP